MQHILPTCPTPTIIGSTRAPRTQPTPPPTPEEAAASLTATRKLIEENSDARMVFLSQHVGLIARSVIPPDQAELLELALTLERGEPPIMDVQENEVRSKTLQLIDAYLKARATVLHPALSELREAHLIVTAAAPRP